MLLGMWCESGGACASGEIPKEVVMKRHPFHVRGTASFGWAVVACALAGAWPAAACGAERVVVAEGFSTYG